MRLKTATNLTPVETVEETTYNVLMVGFIATFITSTLLLAHLIIYYKVFSYYYLSLGLLSFFGTIAVGFWKRKRFGDKNFSLAERIVRIEGILGTTLNDLGANNV